MKEIYVITMMRAGCGVTRQATPSKRVAEAIFRKEVKRNYNLKRIDVDRYIKADDTHVFSCWDYIDEEDDEDEES